MSWGFPSHKNTIFLTMRTNMTFPRWEKTSTGTGRPSAVHKQEGTVRDRNMCRLVTVERGLRLRRTKKGNVKENRQVNWALLLLSSSSSPLSSSTSSSSVSPLCRVSTLIFLRQTMSLGNTVLELF